MVLCSIARSKATFRDEPNCTLFQGLNVFDVFCSCMRNRSCPGLWVELVLPWPPPDRQRATRFSLDAQNHAVRRQQRWSQRCTSAVRVTGSSVRNKERDLEEVAASRTGEGVQARKKQSQHETGARAVSSQGPGRTVSRPVNLRICRCPCVADGLPCQSRGRYGVQVFNCVQSTLPLRGCVHSSNNTTFIGTYNQTSKPKSPPLTDPYFKHPYDSIPQVEPGPKRAQHRYSGKDHRPYGTCACSFAKPPLPSITMSRYRT